MKLIMMYGTVYMYWVNTIRQFCRFVFSLVAATKLKNKLNVNQFFGSNQ